MIIDLFSLQFHNKIVGCVCRKHPKVVAHAFKLTKEEKSNRYPSLNPKQDPIIHATFRIYTGKMLQSINEQLKALKWDNNTLTKYVQNHNRQKKSSTCNNKANNMHTGKLHKSKTISHAKHTKADKEDSVKEIDNFLNSKTENKNICYIQIPVNTIWLMFLTTKHLRNNPHTLWQQKDSGYSGYNLE